MKIKSQISILFYLINLNLILSKDIEDLSKFNLTNFEDNSLFTRWRPIYHISSPNSWMNDPCAPYYNRKTKTYHLYYQVQPRHIQWGNISWGHVKSKDMIFWEDVISWEKENYVSLIPGKGNNESIQGVFTGSALPISPTGDETNGIVTIIYTSVKYLPVGWNVPYKKGSETQSLAISYDDGITFEHYGNNPIIISPPDGWNITGWRDPKFEKWKEMDLFLYGSNQNNYYMTISSGIRGIGPRLLLYQSSSSNNLTHWKYLGPILSVPGNYTLNKEWSGSLGYNFEVSNSFSLREKIEDGGDNQTIHIFTSIGTEGGNTSLHQSPQWSIWIEGILSKEKNNNIKMDIIANGVTDWGDAYAFNSFYDSIYDRRIFYGWIKENHENYGERSFGYNGQLTIPREVFVQVIPNIININNSLSQQGPWTITSNPNGTNTFKTLGIRPINEIIKLRENSQFIHRISQKFNRRIDYLSLNISSLNFELKVNINISLNSTAGFIFRRSSNGLEYTTLYYDPFNEYLILNRTYSSLIKQFQNHTIYAKHILLTKQLSSNLFEKELLSLQIFVDNSLIEIYANNRTVISTHIYPSLLDSLHLGYFVGETNGVVEFSDISIWSNLQNIFPLRPLNTSMDLVALTNNMTIMLSNFYFFTLCFCVMFILEMIYP
ncbi:hypothetical protein I4U23_010702 [Adineta vaga]|nr:hypothetical protein I4U23_010702 [Adineta vaga]